MSKGVTIRDDLHSLWKLEQNVDDKTQLSLSDWIDEIRFEREELQKQVNSLHETTINQEGRFENSKTLAGQTIFYKVKEEPPLINKSSIETLAKQS